MKNYFFILILICSVFFSQIVKADNETNNNYKGLLMPASKSKKKGNDICKGGFFLNLGLFIPMKNYAFPPDFNNTTGDKFSIGYNLDLGNQFRLADLGEKAINLRVTWFSASYTKFKYEGKVILNAFQGNLLKLGPSFTTALSDKMAVDVYYQLSPTIFFPIDDEIFWGVTNSLGADIRINVFALGFDYNFGNIAWWDRSVTREIPKMRTSNLRIFAGFKF